MDIRKPSQQPQQQTVQPVNQQKETNKFKAGVVNTADAKLILPPAIQQKLTALTTKYGIPFDLSNIGLDGKMADNVKALRTIVDMVTGDSKLLPEMLKLIKQLMNAEIKLAQFHRGVVTASLKHQKKIDKYTADIFLKMAGYGAKATKLEHRTNVRNQLKERRTAAYGNYYQNTVYGAEAEIIDSEFETLASNKRILKESKQERIKLDSERKQKINQYVQSAYLN
jgi:hypothetical protein